MNTCQYAEYAVSGLFIFIAVAMFVYLLFIIKEAFWMYRVDKDSRTHGGCITSWSEYRD